MLNGHGDDIFGVGAKVSINFSSNVYRRADLSDLDRFLCENISEIHSYPDPNAGQLKNVISEKYNISSCNICVTNGATEAIYLLAQAFGGSKTAVVIPTFSEYEDACRIHGHRLYFVRRLAEIEPGTDLVWLCNPNNPTGEIHDEEALRQSMRRHADAVFVIDQSYAAFLPHSMLGVSDLADFKNLVLLHSLTKCFAIPGLRLGYLTASESVVKKIETFSMPWSVNQLAQLAGQFLLSGIGYDYSPLLQESQRLQRELAKIDGLGVCSSDMHYFLCCLQQGTAGELKNYLLQHYGILIRDAANFRGLDTNYFRIAAQEYAENEILIKAIKEWIKLFT